MVPSEPPQIHSVKKIDTANQPRSLHGFGAAVDQPTPYSLPWSLPNALGILGLFVGVQISLGLLIQVLSANTFQATPSLFSFFVIIVASHLITWVGVWWVSQRRHRQGYAYLGLGTKPAFKTLIKAILLGLAAQILGVLLLQLFPPPPDLETPFKRLMNSGALGIGMLTMMAVIMAPLLEEVLFRGLLQPALARWGAWIAIGISAVLFSALHAIQLQGYWPGLTSIFLVGMVLGWLRHRTGLLWASIACHAAYNGLAIVLLLIALAHKAGLS